MGKHVHKKSVLTVRILESQRDKLEALSNQIEDEYGAKLSLADLIREALTIGLPELEKTRGKWIFDYL